MIKALKALLSKEHILNPKLYKNLNSTTGRGKLIELGWQEDYLENHSGFVIPYLYSKLLKDGRSLLIYWNKEELGPCMKTFYGKKIKELPKQLIDIVRQVFDEL